MFILIYKATPEERKKGFTGKNPRKIGSYKTLSTALKNKTVMGDKDIDIFKKQGRNYLPFNLW